MTAFTATPATLALPTHEHAGYAFLEIFFYISVEFRALDIFFRFSRLYIKF